MGISTSTTLITTEYDDGRTSTSQGPNIDDVSRANVTPLTKKGPNQPLINGFRMPTNLTKATDAYSPGVGSAMTFLGSFHGKREIRHSLIGATEIHRTTISLDLERHIRWREAQLPSLLHHQLMNSARAKALINLKNRNVSIGLMLAELNKSVNTVQGYLNDIVGGMVSVKRKSKDVFSKLLTGRYTPTTERRLRRLKDGKRSAKERKRLDAIVGGEYLRFKYGVMPSVYDAQGLIKSFDTLADKNLTIRAQARENVTLPLSQDLNMSIGFWNNPKVVGTLTGTLHATCAVTLYANVKTDGLRTLSKVGFDAGTIAELTWDLTPFSFILDHILPVADMIQAWSAMAGLSFKAGTESTHYSVKSMSFDGGLSGSPMAFAGGLAIKADEPYRLTRNAISSPPFPMPYVVNPFKLSNAATWLSLLGALRK